MSNPSQSHDLVPWKPFFPACIRLDTRDAYNEYAEALLRVINYNRLFDIHDHMSEVGEITTSIISGMDPHRFSLGLGDYSVMPWVFLESISSDPESDEYVRLKFLQLFKRAYACATAMAMYDGKGHFPYVFTDWHSGCLVLTHYDYTRPSSLVV